MNHEGPEFHPVVEARIIIISIFAASGYIHSEPFSYDRNAQVG